MSEEMIENTVNEPENKEAIVEGLLYIVGDEGVRAEQIAHVLDISLEDAGVILENIRHKYASELFGIELVDYGSVYKFISKKSVCPGTLPYRQTEHSFSERPRDPGHHRLQAADHPGRDRGTPGCRCGYDVTETARKRSHPGSRTERSSGQTDPLRSDRGIHGQLQIILAQRTAGSSGVLGR